MTCGINLDNISIVLQRPRYSENIGAAVRAMQNMGIQSLMVVNPESYDIEKIKRLATHNCSDAVARIRVFETLQDALSTAGYVVGTTARLGGQRQVMKSPSLLAEKIAPISMNNRVAIVFGPEDRGLTNDDLRMCHITVNIPTAGFSSLNLAQSVMVICYSIFTMETGPKKAFSPRLATRLELDGMYNQLKTVLMKIAYINPENPDYWMSRMRRFFSRLPLRAGEVSMIRGICAHIERYGKKRYKEGLAEATKKSHLQK